MFGPGRQPEGLPANTRAGPSAKRYTREHKRIFSIASSYNLTPTFRASSLFWACQCPLMVLMYHHTSQCV